ncbi:MAG: hypothetical protein MMC33_003737 [Icmadophila ericetorum]|nr:hypothetical protein [Icmadophila ericetorum]
MNDTHYERGGPVFFYDNGEAGVSDGHALGGSTTFAPLELARRYHGIAIIWEHRFYGGSLPFELNQTSGLALAGYEAYKYLNNEQALEDAVYFATHFQPPDYNCEEGRRLSAPSTPWIWIGGSYAGVRAAIIRERNPDVFFASWSSSGPVQTQVDNSVYYNPIRQTMPRNCSADIQAAVSYADDVLTNGSPKEISLLKKAIWITRAANPKSNLTYPGIFEAENLSYWNMAQILAYVFQVSFFHFQRLGYTASLGKFCDQIEAWNPSNFTNFTQLSPPSVLTDNSDDAPITDAGIAATHNSSQFAFYAFLYSTIQKSISDYTRFPINPFSPSDKTSWTWQLCTQFAQFQISNPSHSLISKFNNLTNTLTYFCHAPFPFPYVPAQPDPSQILKYGGGWNMTPSNVMFTNGELDPWRGLSIQATTAKGFNPAAPNRPSTTVVPPCNVAPPGNQVFGQVWPGQVHVSDIAGRRRRLDGLEDGGGNHRDGGDSDSDRELDRSPVEMGIDLFSRALDIWLECFESGELKTPKGGRRGQQVIIQ